MALSIQHKDCIVIGGGIIGMTTARELALRGLTVALFDKSQLGQEASWAAGGILSSLQPWLENQYSATLSNRAKEHYVDFANQLQQQTGIDTEYERCGLLIVNQDIAELNKQWQQSQHILYSAKHLCLPTSMRSFKETMFLPEIAQIRVPKLLQALYACLLDLGVDIFVNTAISKLEMHTGRCTAILAANKKYSANTFVIAAGAWSQQLLPSGCADIKIEPVLGQMICVKFAERCLGPILLDGEHYIIPRKDGYVLIGSTVEYVGFNKHVSKQAGEMLMQWAQMIWPDIADSIFIKQWTGLRPSNQYGKPYLGKLENCENVYINSGHFRHGILQAPACAKVITEMIC